MRAIVVSSPGGPESLEYKDVPIPIFRENEVLVRVEAVGVNYIDVYHWTGLPAAAAVHSGSEASGTVEAIGMPSGLHIRSVRATSKRSRPAGSVSPDCP